MPPEPVDVFVKDTTPSEDPVEGALISVYSADGVLLYTRGSTNDDGYVAFSLEPATYQLRFSKFGTGFKNPKYIEVLASQPNVFDVAADILTPPVANDPRLCVAYGFFRDVSGAPARNTVIHIISKFKPVLLEGSAVLTERVTTKTDSAGYAQLNLIRNGKYDVTVAGFEDYTRCIAVPDAPNVNLPDLLFPVVKSVVFDPDLPTSLAVGEDIQVTPQAILTDGNVLCGPQTVAAIYFSSSAPTIMAVLVAGGVITLRGLAAGTAQLQGVQYDKSVVRIPDPGISGLSAEVVVV